MNEFLRKRVVGLKRNPQIIAMLLIIVACIIYTFSLTTFSSASVGLYQDSMLADIKTTNPKFYIPALYHNPAIYVFLNVLFSILLPISFLSVYKKGKTNWFMFSIAMVMIALMIICDVLYINSLNFYMSEPWGQEDNTGVLAISISKSIAHAITLIITTISILTKPLYGALFNKIDTSIDDEYDDLMDQKSEEELLLDAENDK